MNAPSYFEIQAGEIELEHRHLDRYGARRDEMRRIFETEGDWGRLLASFAQAAAGLETEGHV